MLAEELKSLRNLLVVMETKVKCNRALYEGEGGSNVLDYIFEIKQLIYKIESCPGCEGKGYLYYERYTHVCKMCNGDKRRPERHY